MVKFNVLIAESPLIKPKSNMAPDTEPQSSSQNHSPTLYPLSLSSHVDRTMAVDSPERRSWCLSVALGSSPASGD